MLQSHSFQQAEVPQVAGSKVACLTWVAVGSWVAQKGLGELGAQEKHLERKTSIPSSRATPSSSPKIMATISPPVRTLDTAGTRGEDVGGCLGPPGMMEVKRAHAGGYASPNQGDGYGCG